MKPKPIPTSQPCHSFACAIQDCLTKNSYQEERCRDQIIALYKCCDLFYQENGRDARTPSCPRPDLLKLKLQQYGLM
ncbi:hypothetical protein CISG_07996 [Coccidioides immitis RMSCC 3703]|uniref:Cx9C motif-containing protein 4, mitochondrial n=1 Tax=Coccidioides immitis RMSCC 3703 TaxID=454286 RepID=A0A0J8R5G0_COCIT|nr:hypothetical protein CISG_07996 [Coccidioides immitis RMSCC 3703]